MIDEQPLQPRRSRDEAEKRPQQHRFGSVEPVVQDGDNGGRHPGGGQPDGRQKSDRNSVGQTVQAVPTKQPPAVKRTQSASRISENRIIRILKSSPQAETRKEPGEGTLKLGEMLVREGLVQPRQIEEALQEQANSPEKDYLGIILMRRQLISETEVLKRLSRQKGIDYHDVRDREIPDDVIDKIPRDIALSYNILPVDYEDGVLAVSMEDPVDQALLRQISKDVRYKIRPGFATREDLDYAITRNYNNLVRSNPLVRDFYDGFSYLNDQTPFEANKLIDLILAISHLIDASDIHLTFGANFKMALRINGILHKIPLPGRQMNPNRMSQLKNALKIRSGLDASRKGVPQDGRIELEIDEGQIEARVSLLPLVDAEKIALRLIGRFKVTDFDDLGLSKQAKEQILPILKRPSGMILVAGPTGAGKTTTLYALMEKMPTASRNVITIEDPVEAKLSFASQVQVNREHGLTFSSALRSIIRQDPDIIMLGEIRDSESAGIAVESAMTGHMVLASVHMENAAGTILRMLNLGIESFALSSALSLIIAQRLVPGICRDCRTHHPDTDGLYRQLKLPENVKLYRGEGCVKCYYTGRSGQVALFETIIVDDELRDLVVHDPSLATIVRHVQSLGANSFREDAVVKCLEGLISPEDVLAYS